MENTSVKEEPNSESDSENKNDENDDCNSPEENQIEIKEHVLTKTEKDIEAFNSAEEKYEELPVKQKSFTVKDDFMDASDNPEEECSYPQSSYNKNEIKGVPDFDAISDTEVEKIFCTPMVICPELENIENTENQTHSLLSKKSREAYEKEYEYFDGWCRQNNVEEICESTLIAYFEKESKDKKPSSLWSKYSMLKACLSIKRHVDMSKFTKLSELLRGLAEGYEPKQTKILGIDDINRFMKEAHDRTYLAYKVILIIGYSGACRRDELTNLTIDDVEFENDSILVSISKTKTYIQRQFAIIDETWVDLIKKYVALRPQQITHRRFFLTYRNGSCLNCPIGINTIGRVPKQIAAFLKLPNPELFTGHCFRKSSVSHQVKGDYDPVVIKQEENETECTKPEISQGSKSTLSSLLPLKSRETYEKEYEYFDSWCQQNDVSDVTESTIIAYFDNESKDKKSSSLWAKYSMLKACLNVYNNIDISQFSSLLAFLKRLSEGYEPKQTKILEIEDINRFITEADDGSYLAHKVILIMGYSGACRREEITNLKIDYMKFKNNAIVVSIPKTKSCTGRHFTITDKTWVDLVNKYVNLRPKNVTHRRFFLTYRKGYCVNSPIGINTIGKVPKHIASFLKLPNPELFTGQCFRRSSVVKVKRQRGWKSSAALSSSLL